MAKQSVTEALEVTLEGCELTHGAAPLVASMRIVAYNLDNCFEHDALNKLARTFMLQMEQLRQYEAQPDIEDPFDVLARKLNMEASE